MGLQWVGPGVGTKQVYSLGHLFLLLQIKQSRCPYNRRILYLLCAPITWMGCLFKNWLLKPGTSGAAGRVGDQTWLWGPVGDLEVLWIGGEFFGFTVRPSDSLPLAEGYGGSLFCHLTGMWCSEPLAQILRNRGNTPFHSDHPLAGVTWSGLRGPITLFSCYMKLTCFWKAGWRLIGQRACLPLMQDSVEVFLCIFIWVILSFSLLHLGHWYRA